MCNFGPQLISDFFILNAKVMGTVNLKGAWLATATTCQFSKSSGCWHFVHKIYKCMQKFRRKFLFLKKPV